MKNSGQISIQVDEQGHLILPEEIMREYGLVAGASARLARTESGLVISRSTSSLARVYIEPTNACNLACRTCMRNGWDEPFGNMRLETFQLVMQGIRSFLPLPSVFFGGFGEPLAHPNILEMVAVARRTGAQTELITNATLLNETVARRLVELGLNRLWVSIDGATPESYADIRLGNSLPLVIDNLIRLQEIRERTGSTWPNLGIAFVAMRQNIADLPEIIRLGQRLGADQFSISNVLPHTAELRGQLLYSRSIYDSNQQSSRWSPEISLPRLDLDPSIIHSLVAALQGKGPLRLARQLQRLGTNACPFLEKGSLSVRWDGSVSPCLPLLHTHQSYLAENLRTSHAYVVGNIHEHSLADLWNNPEYVQLRERLQSFDFSPCTFCNSCEMSQSNLEDCFGNVHPACGGCLWAQGFILCP